MTQAVSNNDRFRPAEFYFLEVTDDLVAASSPVEATIDFSPPTSWFYTKSRGTRMLNQQTGWNLTLGKIFLVALGDKHSWLFDTVDATGLVAALGVGIRDLGPILKDSDLNVLLVALYGHEPAGGTLKVDARFPEGETKRFTIVFDNDGPPEACLN